MSLMDTGSTRTCQPCTACCDGWLAIIIDNHEVRPGRPCPYSTGVGCSNYENRPVDPCRTFHCGWRMKGSPLPEWMQPNLSKVIVIPKNMPNGQRLIIATPVGVSIPDKSLNWLKLFADKHKTPLLYTEQILEGGLYAKKQGFNVHALASQKEQVIQALKWLQSKQ